MHERAGPASALPAISKAIWWSSRPTTDEVHSATVPGFHMPSVRASGSPWRAFLRVLPRVAVRPVSVVRARIAGKSFREIIRFVAWLDTAAAFDVTEVIEPGQSAASPLNALLERRPATPREIAIGSVGALVITQDRQDRLRAALIQLDRIDFIDDVVVVDGGSVDGSVGVARAAGARVFERKFDRDFAAQRNFGVSQLAACDWVLRFDDDETFGDGLGEMLRAAMSSAGQCDAILVSQALFVAGQRDARTNLEAMLFRSRLRYRGRLPEFPTWKRPLVLPMGGPLLENHKSLEEMLHSNIVYGSIRPQDYSGDWLENARKALDEIRRGSSPE